MNKNLELFMKDIARPILFGIFKDNLNENAKNIQEIFEKYELVFDCDTHIKNSQNSSMPIFQRFVKNGDDYSIETHILVAGYWFKLKEKENEKI